MHMKLFAALLLIGSAVFGTGPAQAGRACEEAPRTAQQTVQATQMAERTLAAMDSWPDRVVLIGRVGQDLSKYGQTYSHMAFAVRHENGWNVIHELNACGTAESSLYDQGMVDFFSDTPFKYQVGIWRLKPEIQNRLVTALGGKTALRMHDAHYNMLAYPFSTKYQNSNAWVLEVLAYAMAPQDEVATRTEAQAWLKRSGFAPTQLKIGAMTRLGAKVSKANIAFDDHPPELRWDGKIHTVTVASVISFVGQAGGCNEPDCLEHSLGLE